MRSIFSLSGLCLVFSALLVSDVNAASATAGPITARPPHSTIAPPTQPTSVPCTEARLNILVDLIVSEDATRQIPTKNPATKSAVQAAEKGFALAYTGIRTIARAILDNQAAPENARDQVGQGIINVKKSIVSIKGPDATNANVVLANKTIDLAAVAANAVVENCK